MTTPRAREKPRRTQEERSTAMRQRLLDSTIECLVEFGYNGTTTSKVAERAGVTRGAQVHHFPTKNDLVTAAVRHLAAKRAEIAFAQLDRIRLSDDIIGDALDLLWEIHKGPVFSAAVELWVAARTDPELRVKVGQVEPLATGSLMEFSKAVFPDLVDYPQFQHWVWTAMDAARGILISGFAVADEKTVDQRWDRARSHLTLLARVLMADTGLIDARRPVDGAAGPA